MAMYQCLGNHDNVPLLYQSWQCINVLATMTMCQCYINHGMMAMYQCYDNQHDHDNVTML